MVSSMRREAVMMMGTQWRIRLVTLHAVFNDTTFPSYFIILLENVGRGLRQNSILRHPVCSPESSAV